MFYGKLHIEDTAELIWHISSSLNHCWFFTL